jgi:hypothetical protein
MHGCEVCQHQGTSRNPIILLQELGINNEPPYRIGLCQSCLSKREVMSWSAKRAIGEEIARALAEHPQSHGHYSYLGEPNRIHLVRMRSGWLAQHVGVSE